MTSLAIASQQFESTSAAGSMDLPPVAELMLVGGWILSDVGTSVQRLLPPELVSRLPRLANQTTSGASLPLTECSGAAIGELRRLSGLTWDQLARLFKVSRRSLHFWASGKAMTPSNEEHLQRMLAVVRKVDRGSAASNRALLLVTHRDGTIPFDLLAQGQYERVVALLRGGQEIFRVVAPPPSKEAKAARAPRPPEELVSALQDRIHRERDTGRPAKSVKVRGGG